MSESFSINLLMVRIGFIVLLWVAVLPTLIAYLVLWKFLPVGPQEMPPSSSK